LLATRKGAGAVTTDVALAAAEGIVHKKTAAF